MSISIFCNFFLILQVIFLSFLPLKVFALSQSATPNYFLFEKKSNQNFENKDKMEVVNFAKQAMYCSYINQSVKLYKLITGYHSKSRFYPEALYQIGCIYQKIDHFEKSLLSFQLIFDERPEYKNYENLILQQYKLCHSVFQCKRKRFWRFKYLKYYNRNIHRIFINILKYGHDTDYAPIAIINNAITSQYCLRERNHIDKLNQIINNYARNFNILDVCMWIFDIRKNTIISSKCEEYSLINYKICREEFMMFFKRTTSVNTIGRKVTCLDDVMLKNQLHYVGFYKNIINNTYACLLYYNLVVIHDKNNYISQKAYQELYFILNGI